MTVLLVIFTILLFIGIDYFKEKRDNRLKDPKLFYNKNLGFTIANGSKQINKEK
jgi:hypothetical protein